MSATGLDVFDRTLQTTNIWLNEIMEDIGPDRQMAWKVLAVVLHKLRDRLSVELAAHLGSQLPLLIRGSYYDQYQPRKQPTDCNTFDEFVQDVADELANLRPTNPKAAVQAVFDVLSRHVSAGQITKIRAALPQDLTSSWPLDSAQGRRQVPRDGGDQAGRTH